jgi:hypothetical protein
VQFLRSWFRVRWNRAAITSAAVIVVAALVAATMYAVTATGGTARGDAVSLASDRAAASGGSAKPTASASASAGATGAKSPSASTSASASASSTASSPAQDLDAVVSAAVAPILAAGTGAAAVSVENLSTGAVGSDDGDDDQFVTASIAKVDILATLLLRSQQSGTAPTAQEQALATTMIENSDNDAASDLYDDLGGAPAITAANQVFGLTDTTVGTDGFWGLTTTTALDQLQLLRVVFGTDSPLTVANQQYIQGLMSQVETDQRWGVSAAADSGTSFMLKNGWLPNPDLWEINSIGEIEHGGQTYLVTVLSDDQTSEDSGISVLQQIAASAVDAISSAGK